MKQRIPSLEDFINEQKFNDKEILPDWISQSDFDKNIKSVSDLNKTDRYIILEPGMDTWQGEMGYIGHSNKLHMFSYKGQGDGISLEFTDKELIQMIKNKEIYKQK